MVRLLLVVKGSWVKVVEVSVNVKRVCYYRELDVASPNAAVGDRSVLCRFSVESCLPGDRDRLIHPPPTDLAQPIALGKGSRSVVGRLPDGELSSVVSEINERTEQLVKNRIGRIV